MPEIRPIPALRYAQGSGGQDVSAVIAPPYDVLTADTKARLLAQSPHNIVAVDLPHLPAKALGPDETYVRAGAQFRTWRDAGVIVEHERPALFVYQQTYDAAGRRYQRRGLFANVGVQTFGKSPPGSSGQGGIYPHEQTFAAAKQDRLKLMQATAAQLSPIFGIYSDADSTVAAMLDEVITTRPRLMQGSTPFDRVQHELWAVEDPDTIARFASVLSRADIFIADGHHRYNTALNYLTELEASGQPVPPRARDCMFVLIAMQDAGMIVLPTHRVLGSLADFTLDRFTQAAAGKLTVTPFSGSDVGALEEAINARPATEHAVGLVVREGDTLRLAIATTTTPDPLAATHPGQSEAWRSLDVAIVQHVIVEGLCQPSFAGGREVTWKFPHELAEVTALLADPAWQLGLILRPTPLDAVRRVAEAGELMPQKSTFFYPKLATGLLVNPLA